MSRYKKFRITNILEELIGRVFIFILSLIVALFIVSNIASLTLIKERSMEPTFVENDRILVYKLGLLLAKPSRGDMIVLNTVQMDKGFLVNMKNEAENIKDNINYRITGEIRKNNLIKRVIGLPNDIIDIKDGVLLVNSIPEEKSYAQGYTYEGSKYDYPITVPEGKYFVLGDNREYSLDSRDLGFIDEGQIKGKAVFKIYPLSKFGKIN